MRAGRLKTRKYKIHRGAGGRLLLIALLIAAAAAGAYAGQQSLLPLHREVPLDPSPTLTPEDGARESRQLVLPGSAWYALQLGAFEGESAVQTEAAAYRSRGAAGYVDPGGAYRLLAAAYATRAEAQAVQHQLNAQHSVETYIVEIARPEVTLRLTGQRAQLTALQDAYTLIDQAAEQMSGLSQGLDNHTLTASDILPALRSQQETAASLIHRLDQLFGASAPQEVQDVRAILTDFQQQLAAALTAQGSTALGAQLKYCHVLCVCRMAAYAARLASR